MLRGIGEFLIVRSQSGTRDVTSRFGDIPLILVNGEPLPVEFRIDPSQESFPDYQTEDSKKARNDDICIRARELYGSDDQKFLVKPAPTTIKQTKARAVGLENLPPLKSATEYHPLIIPGVTHEKDHHIDVENNKDCDRMCRKNALLCKSAVPTLTTSQSLVQRTLTSQAFRNPHETLFELTTILNSNEELEVVDVIRHDPKGFWNTLWKNKRHRILVTGEALKDAVEKGHPHRPLLPELIFHCICTGADDARG